MNENMDCGFEDWVQDLLWITRLNTFFVCDASHASFHPFKDVEDWTSCWYWANGAKSSSMQRVYMVVALLCGPLLFIKFKRWRKLRNRERSRASPRESSGANTYTA